MWLTLLRRVFPKGFWGWNPQPVQTAALHRGPGPSEQQLLTSHTHPQPLQWTAAGNLEWPQPLMLKLASLLFVSWIWCSVLSLLTRGCWDVFQRWRSTLRASHWSAGRHWEVMGRSLLMFMSVFCFASTFDAIWVSVMWAALPLSRRFPLSRRRGWWGPASRPETLTTTRLSSESKPTPPTRTSSSSSLSRWRSHQVRSRPSESCLTFNTLSLLSGWYFSPFLLQLLVFTPPQRCLTLVHCDHKVHGP